DVPTMTSWKPFAVAVSVTLLITGAEPEIFVDADGGVEGVMSTPAALSESETEIVPGSVPTWNGNVTCVVFAGMVICVVRDPFENIRSVVLAELPENDKVAVTVIGSGYALPSVIVRTG